jgi:RNA recognition motif-containing protein
MGQDYGGAASSNPGKAIQEDNLYVKGLPPTITEDFLKQIFAQYCNVDSVKVLPMTPGMTEAVGFVRCRSKDEARWVKENFHLSQPLNGLEKPVVIRFAGERAPVPGVDVPRGPKGGGKSKAPKQPGVNLYIKGLPTTITEDGLRDYSVISSPYNVPRCSRYRKGGRWLLDSSR